MKIRPLRIVLAVAVVVLVAYVLRDRLFRVFIFGQQTPPVPLTGLSLADTAPGDVRIIAENLEIPWQLAVLPDGSLLVTERRGRLVHLGSVRRTLEVPGVRHVGEGGLMGMALDPDFAANQRLYLCLTADGASGLENRVERYRWTGAGITERAVILDRIPAAQFHDGCGLAFGPDGLLYITTGDATDGALAQDRTSLAGKILRVTAGGEIPLDNPFGTHVYSWGHRNAQGLAWDDGGRLWSTEHGRSGLESGLDEINRIEPGRNYGWPVMQGDRTRDGMAAPLMHSGPDYTWAPAGVAYRDGSLFFGGLRGAALYEARLEDDEVAALIAHFYGDFGRIRAVTVGPDGMLYFTTSNRDARGPATQGDDRIVRVNPALFRR